MKSLFEPQVGLIGRVMDMQLERQNIVSGNIANIKTPGYKAKKVTFEEELQKSLGLDMKGKMSRTDGSHMPTVFSVDGFGADLRTAVRPRIIHGEDRVNLDKEMATLAKSNLHYSALTSAMKNQFDMLKTAIQEGQK